MRSVFTLFVAVASLSGGLGSAWGQETKITSQQANAAAQGLLVNLASFDEVSFKVLIEEWRYLPEPEGTFREVALLPKELAYKASKGRVWFWHNGGGFSGDTKGPFEGIYEGVSNGQDRSVVLDHTNKVGYIRRDPSLSSWGVEDPRFYFGQGLEGLVGNATESGDGKVLGERVVHGDSTIGIEFVDEIQPHLRHRVWIDSEHGFLPRRREWIVVRTEMEQPEEILLSDWEVVEVRELASSVWVPAVATAELHRTNTSGFHARRHVRFMEIDIESSIPDDVFTLSPSSEF